MEEEEPILPPEGKYGLACVACGGGGDVACCEVGGCVGAVEVVALVVVWWRWW